MRMSRIPAVGLLALLICAPQLFAASDSSGRPGGAELMERIEEALTAVRSPAGRSATARTAGPTPWHADRVAGPDQVRLRPGRGTPMQIRGRTLMRADRSRADGPARDAETAGRFLRARSGLLGLLDPDGELRLARRRTDRLGYRHLRYDQRFRGIPVWPAQLIVHLDGRGDVYLLDGSHVRTPRKSAPRPALDRTAALAAARSAVPGGRTAGADGPELIYYAPPEGGETRLAWKAILHASLTRQWVVVVDAVTGGVLTAYNRVATTAAEGSGVDLLGVRRNLNLWFENDRYYLVDTTKPMFDPVDSDPPNPNRTEGAVILLDAENEPPTDRIESVPLGPFAYVTSGLRTSGWLPDAVSAAHNISETYDYFREYHGRAFITQEGDSVVAIVRVGQDYANAAWADVMIFGDAEPFAAALDVVAHELTHGVTTATANLIYQGESGALNEAFSDIFGEMVEHRTEGATDWTMGSGLSRRIRSLSDPGSLEFAPGFPYPSTMGEFIQTTEDNGGVHWNATIVGHAFYLLAQGMDGAIGLGDAERIFYRALVYHLVASSRFIDARLACIASAEELFGEGSVQALRTAEAFDAVGIFDAAPTPEPDETGYIPPPSGPDALLFIRWDEEQGAFFLGRREERDPPEGVRLSSRPVSRARASVTEDGQVAAYVDYLNDMCLIFTDGTGTEECLGYVGLAHSVAMSPDGELYGFVFLDENGLPGGAITVIDIGRDDVREYELVAPAFDGVSTNTIISADQMNFTSDNRLLIYDALNRMELNDGSSYDAWSIYALDLATGQTLVLAPPTTNVDIGFPALSQTNDNFITFDAFNPETLDSTIRAMNLIKNRSNAITTVEGDWGTPFYTGDDAAIIYSQKNTTTATGFSIYRQPVAEDRITPVGSSALYLANADFGTIYRRAGTGGGDDDGGDDGTGGDGGADDGGGGGGGCFIASAGTVAGSARGPAGAVLLAVLLVRAWCRGNRVPRKQG